jgi:excisionase family DNA binding protein
VSPLDASGVFTMPADATLTESTDAPTITTVDPGRRLADALPPAATYDVRDLAALLRLSVRQVWRLSDSGKLPKPFRFGRAVRWSRAVVDKWLESGAAPRGKSR